MIEKRVVVVHALTGRQTPVKVAEGARPAEILQKLNLKDHYLARVTGRQPLPEDTDVAAIVEEGEHLLAASRMVIGGGFCSFFAALFGTEPKKGKTEAAATPPSSSSVPRARAAASVSVRPAPPRVPPPPAYRPVSTAALRPAETATSRPVKALAVQPRERVFVLNELREQPVIPYWQLRGWRNVAEGLYLGYFKTPLGRCHGVVKWNSEQDFGFYVHDVPQALLDGPHGGCFAEVKPGKFRIHFSRLPSDVNSGIFYIETLLQEAFQYEPQM